MTLTKNDLQLIQQTLQPEFDKVETRIKAALQPEFDKLNRKIENLRKSNRKDHNLIINTFDERDRALRKRITKLEDKLLTSHPW